MQQISNKKLPLAHLFKAFDSGHDRIDSTELFSVMMIMSKGDDVLKVACKGI